MPGKKTEGAEWDQFVNALMDQESKFKGTDEEVDAQLKAYIVEQGYDHDEVMAALRGKVEDVFANATVINLDDKPVDQREFIAQHGRPYYGAL